MKLLAVKAAWAALKMPIAPLLAPTGMVTRIWLSLTTTTLALCAAPTQARFEPLKPLPLTVTTVPGAPLAGVKLLICCCGKLVGVDEPPPVEVVEPG